jgi:hypothetical protein
MSLDQAKNEESEGLLRSGNPALVIVSDGTNWALPHFRHWWRIPVGNHKLLIPRTSNLKNGAGNQ